MAMTHRTAEFVDFMGQDREAKAIAELWTRWNDARQKDMELKRETRNYVFATDTRSTSGQKLPWRNSTTIPKLCQLRDSFHANYMARLFPNDDWLSFEADEQTAAVQQKRKALEAYIGTKLKDMDFRTTMSKLVYDFIDYGNAFAGVEWRLDKVEDEEDGTDTISYVGPHVYRISPEDIVFDITADAFEHTPVVIRSIKSMGDFEKDILTNPFLQYDPEAVNKLREQRRQVKGRCANDKAFKRWQGLSIDGFGSIDDYYNSGYIEILEFTGDWYDAETGELHTNVLITVADRTTVLRSIKNPVWGGRKLITHVGWRLRPDNLLAMGPLDNLVGIQYRIDHLENLRADAADMALLPVIKRKGWVEDFEWEPLANINVGDDGDVAVVNAGNIDLVTADNMIERYMALMEKLAGHPSEAMGFRTPGEKTAYEVQRLENSSDRVFNDKIGYFEQVFVEKNVNLVAIMARQYFSGTEKVKIVDSTYGAELFVTVTKQDLLSKGKFRAMGARHFAENAILLQNMNNFANSALAQDEGIALHISGKKKAFLVEKWLGMGRFNLVEEFSGLQEKQELQAMLAQQQQPQDQEEMNGQPGPSAGGGLPL